MPESTSAPPYEALNPTMIAKTAERLRERVNARFPTRGLNGVAAELVHVVRTAETDAAEIARPRWGLRLAIGVLVTVIVATFVFGVVLAFRDAGSAIDDLSSFDWLGIAESAITTWSSGESRCSSSSRSSAVASAASRSKRCTASDRSPT